METCSDGVLCVIIALCILVFLLKNKNIDSFIVLLNEIIIPKKCPDYLVTDGRHYYLLNSRLPYDGVNNPLKFNSEEEARQYLESNQCPSLALLDLVVSKNPEDPTDSYEKVCAQNIAKQVFNDDICNQYSSKEQIGDLREYSRALMILVEKRNQIRSTINAAKFASVSYDKQLDINLQEIQKQMESLRKKYSENDEALKEFVDYKIEDCMIQTIKNENKDLDDTHFTDQFAKYFNQLNENIGQEYLYV